MTLPPASAQVVPWYPHNTLFSSILIPGTPISVGSPFLLVSPLGSLSSQYSNPRPVGAAWPHAVQPPPGCSSYCQATVGQRLSLGQGLGSTGESSQSAVTLSTEFSLKRLRARVLPCCYAVRNRTLPQVRVQLINGSSSFNLKGSFSRCSHFQGGEFRKRSVWICVQPQISLTSCCLITSWQECGGLGE